MAEDRRARRTRRLLREAMVRLVLERGYAGVTVEDIAEHADVGRATFYSHYRDKDDLLTQVVAELLEELEARTMPLISTDSAAFTGKPVLEVFRHARQERDLYRIILRGEGDGRALRQLIDGEVALAERVLRARAEHHGVQPRLDLTVLARASVGEQFGVLSWWLEQDPPAVSAEDVNAMLLELSLRGRHWASGFDDTDLPADGSPAD